MSEISKVNDIEQASEFLGSVFGHDVDGLIAIWTKQDKQTKFFTAQQKQAYLAYIASKLGTHDVYYSVCLLQPGLKVGRGKVEDVIAVPGVWLDIDINDDAHKANHYPTSVDEAMEILKEFPLSPTTTIFSGYGLHVYWLFKELWMLESPEEREAAQQYSTDFQRTLQGIFSRKGYKIDNTSDLARVLRVPGTLNHKMEAPKPVSITEIDDTIRYNLADLEQFFIEETSEKSLKFQAKATLNVSKVDRQYPPSYMESILKPEGCAWMRHCQYDSESLPENEWYQSLTVTNCCDESDKWAHIISQGYNGYSKDETDEKMAHIRSGGYGPVTCNYVRQHFEDFCDDCEHDVKSPVVLGRAKAKKAGKKKSEDNEHKETAQEVLIRLSKNLNLYRTEMDEAWVELPIKSHFKAVKVGSKEHRRWLTHAYYQDKGKGPGAEAVSQVFEILDSQAVYEGDKRDVYLRAGRDGGKIYYDLCAETGQVVEVSMKGWAIVDRSPVLFERTRNMIAQVTPAKKGDLTLISKHIRLKSKDDQMLLMVYLVACLIPDIPHVISVLSGEKGASKTTTMKKIRKLIDPAIKETMVLPKSIDELTLQLSKNYMPSYDNIDHLTHEISDILCMAATGGGISKRELYTNDGEVILTFLRCVVLNGINTVVSRPDIVDRSVISELERIEKHERKDEASLWKEFEIDRPLILGGMFDTLARAMAIYPKVQIEELPRMADYAKWGYAIAEALGIGGQEFLDAYGRNQARVNQEVIDDHPVASVVASFMSDKFEWKGTVDTLLGKLVEVANRENIDCKDRLWPKRANILGKRLNEIKSNLQEIGINFSKEHNTVGTVITVTNANVTVKRVKKRLAILPKRSDEISNPDFDLDMDAL